GTGGGMRGGWGGAGRTVALADVDGAGASRNAAELGARSIGLVMDVTVPASVAEAVAEAQRRLGPIDILVSNAGISRSTAVWDVSLEEFDQVMGLNVRGGVLS